MAERAPSANPLHDAAPVTEMTPDDKTGGSIRFSPRGVPVIIGVNRVGLFALYMKEVRRFLKVQTQTIWAPAFTGTPLSHASFNPPTTVKFTWPPRADSNRVAA